MLTLGLVVIEREQWRCRHGYMNSVWDKRKEGVDEGGMFDLPKINNQLNLGSDYDFWFAFVSTNPPELVTHLPIWGQHFALSQTCFTRSGTGSSELSGLSWAMIISWGCQLLLQHNFTWKIGPGLDTKTPRIKKGMVRPQLLSIPTECCPGLRLLHLRSTYCSFWTCPKTWSTCIRESRFWNLSSTTNSTSYSHRCN